MELSLMRDLQKNEAVRIVAFVVTNLTTSSARVTDEDGNQINYPCKGLEIHNREVAITRVLMYSFDNSTWFKIYPLGFHQDERKFDGLWVKLAAGTGECQGKVAKIQ